MTERAPDVSDEAPGVSRRTALGTGVTVTAALAGSLVAGSALAGCTNSGSSYPTEATADIDDGTVVALTDVPIGGVTAATIDGEPGFVARPTEDSVRAFSATCTHQGCRVQPHGDILLCPCHGSHFAPLTGDVLRGPATEPLPPIAVHLEGPDVVAG